MITVNADKFSELWHGQALSDVIDCLQRGHQSFQDQDINSLNKIITHLHNNFIDYMRIESTGVYTVERVYQWLGLALDNLRNNQSSFSTEQLESLYDKWFFGESHIYGDGVSRWRKIDFALPLLTVIDKSFKANDTETVEEIWQVLNSMQWNNILDEQTDLTPFDLMEYIKRIYDSIEDGDTSDQAIAQSRAILIKNCPDARLLANSPALVAGADER